MSMSCPSLIDVSNDGRLHDPAASLVASHMYLGCIAYTGQSRLNTSPYSLDITEQTQNRVLGMPA